MSDPKTIASKGWEQSCVEILVLYVLTTIGVAYLLQLHWLVAMVTSPVIMLLMLVGVMLMVQVLWMTVLGLERIGTACGMRKSPLS